LEETGVQRAPVAGALAPSRWTLTTEGLSINYLGVTAELDWLVLILEPDPRIPGSARLRRPMTRSTTRCPTEPGFT
jgi:hypothetical protein